jgi:3-oxoacyl-[acyl-carrier protein] reductase
VSKQLSGKWAFITGSSRGIGRQISLHLADLGCNVIVHSRESSHTVKLLEELKNKGIQAHEVSGELSEQSQVDRILDDVLRISPQIDILYNNAALMTPYRTNPWEVPAEDFRKSFEINVISLARICYKLIPLMIARKSGTVVNITSGIMNEPQLCAYALSKAAVDKFVKDFVPALEGTGVTMNLLDPGWLRTDLGGPNAPNSVESVIPGVLVPALLDDKKSGRIFRAQDFAGLSLDAALEKARTLVL